MRKLEGGMLLTFAKVYVTRSASVHFHIPLDAYSCGFKCNTFPLFVFLTDDKRYYFLWLLRPATTRQEKISL
jgi:hypothetical protein